MTTMQDPSVITRVNRKIVEKILDNHTLAHLNKVPEGFRNNLIWHLKNRCNLYLEYMLAYNPQRF